MTSKKPLILIPANVIDYNGMPGHIVRDTYVQALLEVAGCVPLLLPAIGDKADFQALLDIADGILLTGSPSHVCPARYGAQQVFEDKELDLARDATTLPFIQHILDTDTPLIAICRGFQELNVAMGGTLHQRIHELPGKNDHREPKGTPLKTVYETQAHNVLTQKGGWFEKLGLPDTFKVNSLHQQGVDRLGNGLHVEAVTEDGIIEAISIPNKRFVLGTQWHPEGDFHLNDSSVKIFKAFGEAVRSQKHTGSLKAVEAKG